MELKVASGDITQAQADTILVNLFEGVQQPSGATAAVDQALDGAISYLIQAGEVKGKAGEATVVHTFGKLPALRVVVVGLGKQEDLKADTVRKAAGNVARRVRALGARKVATVVHGAGAGGLDPETAAQALAEGAVMGLYRFDRHKQPEQEPKRVEEITVVEADAGRLDAVRRGVERGRILAEAANFARDLANEPANVLTPTELAARAEAMAREAGLTCEVYDRPWMEQQGMGGLLGVARGSAQPPKFIVLHYRGDPESQEALALVGKGITFDTGGISIKPAQGMEEMKGDMSGAAAVIAAMQAIARLRPRINVTALAPATENMPGGNATKPGDVLRAMNGKTMEVINTDAEGRLILADALSYAVQHKLSPIVDVATLTGACIVALGTVATGAMTNNAEVLREIMAAGEAAGEKFWELPMFEEYRELIKSDVADIKNTGGRDAGAITAAWFLREFVDDTPWVHLDMAGTDNSKKEEGPWVKGATGIPVRTLVNFVLARAERRGGAPK